MLKTVAEGLDIEPEEAAPGVQAGRLELEQLVFSDQPGCEADVSDAENAEKPALSTMPMYHVTIWLPPP